MTFAILATHYLFDWVFQTRFIAENKSKRLDVLTIHVSIYTAGLILLAVFSELTIVWALFNGAAHFIVDFFSSKSSAYYWAKGEHKKFWNTVGADQLIHYLILFGSYELCN